LKREDLGEMYGDGSVNANIAIVNDDNAIVGHDGANVIDDNAVVGDDGAIVNDNNAVVGHNGGIVDDACVKKLLKYVIFVL
jgi:hypothetical protein